MSFDLGDFLGTIMPRDFDGWLPKSDLALEVWRGSVRVWWNVRSTSCSHAVGVPTVGSAPAEYPEHSGHLARALRHRYGDTSRDVP